MSRTLVSVIIPARNEEASIVDAIESVATQSYGTAALEIVIVDGRSTDDTRRRAEIAMANRGFRRSEVISGPTGSTPNSLNAGLGWAEGDIVVRVDARSRIPNNYVEAMVDRLGDESIAVAGGTQLAVARDTSVLASGIARALNNRFGMGLSKYRSGEASSGPVDTVYLGSFRASTLRAAGGWNETFPTNQDFELNRRMSALGSVWFEQGLPVRYLPRATLGELFSQYHRFGRWKVFYWRFTGDPPRSRQVVLMASPLLLLAGSGAAVVAIGFRAVPILGAAAAAGAAIIDHVGAEGAPASLLRRLVATAASVCVGAGWLSGIATEVLRPRITPGPVATPTSSASRSENRLGLP